MEKGATFHPNMSNIRPNLAKFGHASAKKHLRAPSEEFNITFDINLGLTPIPPQGVHHAPIAPSDASTSAMISMEHCGDAFGKTGACNERWLAPSAKCGTSKPQRYTSCRRARRQMRFAPVVRLDQAADVPASVGEDRCIQPTKSEVVVVGLDVVVQPQA